MITETERFIEAPWGRICIVTWGHCYNPPVLVCHGILDSIVSFRPLVKLLPKNFYYVGVELPGNGKSDPFPPGLLMTFYDLVCCLEVVVKHFRWESFVFLGHSAGASVGLLWNYCLPGKITRLILLDPTTPTVNTESFTLWYQGTYQKLFDNFGHYNNQKERRPTYTRQEALNKLLKIDGMSEELAAATLDRVAEGAGDGLVSFTFDQRYKILAWAPLTANQLKELYQKTDAPILFIAASQSVQIGRYYETSFLLDESIFYDNYRARQMEAHHNIHMSPSDVVVTLVSQFLIHGPEGLGAKAKL